MSEIKFCPKCAGALRTDVPAGICPKCLLQAGREGSHAEGTGPAETLTFISDAAQTATSVGSMARYFGDYELLQEIARGGMGVVYKARQINLNRLVALKMILAGQLASPADVQRFYTEAEAAAKLDHPGIVPIFEVGQHAGQHFFSMGFIEGRSLAARVAEGPLPPREAVLLLREIALSVQYAHDKGVIHRDLKPGNILLDVQGRPRVTDFGLAKLTESDKELTGSGQIMGTPSYMPPEQASGKIDQIGPLADVYSLGAILYCLLTGRPPFQAASPLDTLMQVLDREPVSIRQLNPHVPLDLETICLKCLEKPSSKRYVSASALAEDLRCFIEDEPISARPVTRWERAWKWARKRPAVAALLVLTPLALLAGVGLMVSRSYTVSLQVINKDLKIARDTADWARNEADDLRGQTERALVKVESFRANSLIVLANRSLLDGESAQAQVLLQQVPDGLRNWEWKYLDRLSGSSQESDQSHSGLVSCVTFSNDGKRFASGSWDQTIHVRDQDPWSEKKFVLTGHNSPLMALVFSPDNLHLASSSQDGTIKIWNVTSKAAVFNGGTARKAREILTLRGEGFADCLAFAPNTAMLASGDRDGKSITIWDPSLGNRIHTLDRQADVVLAVAFSPDSRRVAAAIGSRVQIWDTTTWQLLRTFDQHATIVQNLVFLPDGKRVISTSVARQSGKSDFWIWDLAAEAVPTLATLPGPSSRLALSKDGRQIALGGTDGIVWIRDAETLQLLAKIRAHDAGIGGLAFHPDGRRLATSSGEGTTRGEVRIWNLQLDIVKHRVIGGQGSNIDMVAFDPDSERIAGHSGKSNDSASNDGKIRFWDLKTGRELQSIPAAHSNEGSSVALSPNFQSLATFNPAGAGSLRDVITGTQIGSWPGHHEKLLVALVFSPDNRLLGAASDGGSKVHVWDTETRRDAGSLQLPKGSCRMLAFSPNGKRVLTVGANPETAPRMQVWDLATQSVAVELQQVEQRLTCVAWSSDDKYIAAGASNANLRIWNAQSGQLTHVLQAHPGGVCGVAFSPDSQRLVSGGQDGSVRLWNPDYGLEVLDLPGVEIGVGSVAWSPDSKKIAAGTAAGTILVWENFHPTPVIQDPFFGTAL